MIEVAKAHERTCQEYQIHKQAHSMANPSNSYANPLIQTNALSKSSQKGPPKKTCGKCGRSHSHGDCPAYGTTCSKCGQPNHWTQQCRGSGRRNSSTGHSPSPVSDREGHGHKAVLYKSHFSPLRHSFRQRHHCIHRLINHVYTQRPKLFVIHCPTTSGKATE